MENILIIRRVSKHYGSKRAVDDISLEVPRGAIFGLLGPNGAGKTSLIRMITTITRPDSGTILLHGEPLGHDHPRKIGYLPEERGLYKKMNVGEHLLYLAQLKGMSKLDATNKAKDWLEKLNLSDRWGQPVESLSKGLQQQVQFVATVLHGPELLILDEPFSGLDPVNTKRLEAEIRHLHEQGTTILFSTHRMEQVEEICESIALINQGKKILEGSVRQVREQYKKNIFKLSYSGELPEGFQQQFDILSHHNQTLTLKTVSEQSNRELITAILATGLNLTSFEEVLPRLNEIFIHLVSPQQAAAMPNQP